MNKRSVMLPDVARVHRQIDGSSTHTNDHAGLCGSLAAIASSTLSEAFCLPSIGRTLVRQLRVPNIGRRRLSQRPTLLLTPTETKPPESVSRIPHKATENPEILPMGTNRRNDNHKSLSFYCSMHGPFELGSPPTPPVRTMWAPPNDGGGGEVLHSGMSSKFVLFYRFCYFLNVFDQL